MWAGLADSSPSPLCASLCLVRPRHRCLSTPRCAVNNHHHHYHRRQPPLPPETSQTSLYTFFTVWGFAYLSSPPLLAPPPTQITWLLLRQLPPTTTSLKGRCYHTLHCSYQLLNTARRSRTHSDSALQHCTCFLCGIKEPRFPFRDFGKLGWILFSNSAECKWNCDGWTWCDVLHTVQTSWGTSMRENPGLLCEFRA